MTTFAAVPHPRLLLRGELLAQGFTDNHIRRARREGALVVLGQGRYLSAIDWQELDEHGRYHLVLRSAIAVLAGDPVVSHRSAAIVHGVLAPRAEPLTVDITRPGPAKSRHGPVLRVHRGVLGPDEIVRDGQLAVTSMARTVVDYVLTQPAAPAAGLVRDVLAAGHLTPSDLREQLRRQERTPGIRRAAAVVGGVLDGQRLPGDRPDPAGTLGSDAQLATVIPTPPGPALTDSHP